VRHGGRFDGALGVAAAFAVAARAPVAVVSFADEEGARFNTPTFGSRALAGRLDVDDVLSRVDDRGVVLGDAMAGAGVDPEGLRAAPAALERLRGFIELHIDQTRDLEAAGAPAGVVARLAARMRLQVELTGRADHAGTTRRADRRDALAAAARLMVRADELAAERADMVSTTGRIEVEPNAPTTVPSLVRLWIDARAPRVADVESWERALADAAREIGARTGVGIALRVASRSDGVEFDAAVRRALAEGLAMSASGLRSSPVVTSYAGHDAGILGERIPAGMIFVRNPTGVSHAPEEEVSLEDAAVAANALLAAVEALR
jgi:N-carbamoyl-L-amino-acid hydrolase